MLLARALLLLLSLSAVTAQKLDGWSSSAELQQGGSLQLRCRATGPDGLGVRLRCPLAAGNCFEDCHVPFSAAAIPELQAATKCSLQRRQVAPPATNTGSYSWAEVTVEYEFINVSRRHEGNYTCQFMLLTSVSAVKVASAATEASSKKQVTTSSAAEWTRFAADGAVVTAAPTSSTTTVGSVDKVTMAQPVGVPEASPGDWFRIEIYGPITLGHVIAVSLTIVTLLLAACLVAGLVSCYCRRIRRKRRRAKHTNSEDGTAGWATSMFPGRQPPTRGFSTADIEALASASATLQTGVDASIYADVESSPLISGAGGHRQNAAFGSQGRGLNGAAVVVGNGRAAVVVGNGGGSFFTRDQAGRHSFHSVRQQHQILNRGEALSAAASPAIVRKFQHPQPPSHSPQLAFDSPEAAPILQLMAEQRAEIGRLSQQLRSSQQQLNELVASHTDLYRGLSSRQLNSAAQLRHESGPQQQQKQQPLTNEYHQDPSQSRSVAGGVYGSTDALTVETIDEEFEADGTLKTPARKQQK